MQLRIRLAMIDAPQVPSSIREGDDNIQPHGLATYRKEDTPRPRLDRARSWCVMVSVTFLSVWAMTLILSLPAATQSIQLPRPVPSFNQAYTQGLGAWGLCPLGTDGCPDKIWTTGCLVTAFASVLAYYDVQLTAPAAHSCTGASRTGMDPGILNDWLRSVSGFGRCAQDSFGNCCLVWSKLPPHIEITTHVDRNDVGLNPVTTVVIDHALRQGYPVIAGVHWGAVCAPGSAQTRDCHWVVITGKRGDTYTIIDPYNADSTSAQGVRTTLDAGVHGAYSINRYVVVKPSSRPVSGWSVQQLLPAASAYSVGDRVQLALLAQQSPPSGTLFARVTAPSGQLLYATNDPSKPDVVVLTPVRRPLLPPLSIARSDWVFYSHVVRVEDVGTWTWEVWTESGATVMDPPRQQVTYEVTAGSPIATGLTILVILAVVALGVFLSLRGLSE